MWESTEKQFTLNESTIEILKPILVKESDDINSFILNFLKTSKYSKYDVSSFKNEIVDIYSLCDAIGNGVYIIDRNSIIIDSNNYYDILTGLWKEEYLNRPVNYVLDKYFFNTRAVAVEALKSNSKASGIGRSRRTNKDFLVTAIPVIDEKGEVSKVISVIRDITELIILQNELESNLEKTELYKEELKYYRNLEKEENLIIGKSESMEQLKTLILQIASVDSTLLISGDTGVGKEVIAREIHNRSHRRSKAYIKVNCAAIPASLMESELFGYEKGAFTGATKRKLGMFEMANNGTILLDEIGEMPYPLQSKLLRILQERELVRVGGYSPVKLDVRVIASTNRDLKKDVENGKFRKDLYYRLYVIPVQIPPLKDRKDDIPVLAEHFLIKLNKRYGMKKQFSDGVIDIFIQYNWPGNVRELENVVERLMVISNDNCIKKKDTHCIIGGGGLLAPEADISNSSLKYKLRNLEKTIIETTLRETGNSYRTAELLGISQSTVIRKAQKLGIKDW